MAISGAEAMSAAQRCTESAGHRAKSDETNEHQPDREWQDDTPHARALENLLKWKGHSYSSVVTGI